MGDIVILCRHCGEEAFDTECQYIDTDDRGTDVFDMPFLFGEKHKCKECKEVLSLDWIQIGVKVKE
jgi:hypothetical protein